MKNNQAEYQPVHWVAYHESALAYLAKQVITVHADHLPDLSHVHILLAEPSAAASLRAHLLTEAQQAGFSALLGIQISSLRDWAYQHLPDNIQVCDAQSQELILIEALNQYPGLLRSASPWVMAENLLKLFAELTLKHVQLPESPDDFIKQMEAAYGNSSHNFDALGQEARLIHTLWQAWHTQLKAENLYDSNSAYLHGLANSLSKINEQQHFYLAGFQQFNPAEIDWIQQLIKQNCLSLILHGSALDAGKSYHPDVPLLNLAKQLQVKPAAQTPQPYTHFIEQVFNTNAAPLQQRAESFKQQIPESPVQKKLGVFSARSTEQEAHAIELQIRRWLASDKKIKSIAVVTENRRLARRVRALLERSYIPLQDASGWALSTTSAAATIERWLECIEEDFDYLALLDLLKSPFIFADQDATELKQAVYRFEQDVIRHENVNRNIVQYQKALQARRERLSSKSPQFYALLNNLLDKLATIARPLQQLQQNKNKIPASEFLSQFVTSLQQLGMIEAFENDVAGQRLQQAFAELEQATHTINLPMNWQEFRTWLGRHLERMNFQAEQFNSPIQLMGLSQSCLQQFDALIIAGTEQEYLPGRTNISPFFNDTARKELELATTTDQLTERLHHFRRLLESAPRILITLRAEEHGEPVTPSPWLQAIQAFHQQTYNDVLSSPVLSAMVTGQFTVIEDSDTSLPASSTQTSAIIPQTDLPDSFSPTAYQKLMDCPYRFYASYILKLKAPEEVSEALARDEYGKRIHLCLEAFHSDVDDLPGPFKDKLDESQRTHAIQLMNNIAHAVFRADEENNFAHRAWLQQWLNIIPFYIDWEITRQQQWQLYKTEQSCSTQLADNLKLRGRLDRIDSNSENHLSIIDYKTGQIPTKTDVQLGEYVQLPFYALLDDEIAGQEVDEVAYLQLSKAEKLQTRVSLQGDELNELKHAIAIRLEQVMGLIKDGHALPAWGDSKTCSYCEMDKLCRRQAWQETII